MKYEKIVCFEIINFQSISQHNVPKQLEAAILNLTHDRNFSMLRLRKFLT